MMDGVGRMSTHSPIILRRGCERVDFDNNLVIKSVHPLDLSITASIQAHFFKIQLQ